MISIIYLTKNGGDTFAQSLEMVFQQSSSDQLEVIIVDSGSTDDTLEIQKKYPTRLYQIAEKSFSFGPSRDFGFSQARGDYLVTLSQDVVPADKYWLQNLVRPLKEDSADVCQGQVIVPQNKDIFYWEKAGFFYFTREGYNFMTNHGGVGLSCTSLAIKKAVWEATKFGDAVYSEDKAIQKKIFARGFRIILSPDSWALHGHQYSWKTLIKRCLNEGLGWQKIGVNYSVLDLLKDLPLSLQLQRRAVAAYYAGELNFGGELFYPLLRPFCILTGNKVLKSYLK